MESLIKKQIVNSSEGYITYADFIETVLYHPEKGYYMKEGNKIGKEGDFYTTSNVSNIYGKMIAKWYGKLVLEYGLPPEVCEIGAGTGRFAAAFIEEWSNNMKIPLSYTIIETSPFHRRLQQEKIHFNENIKQVMELSDINPFEGLIFSNELFDALPVHVIQKLDNELYEIMVTIKDNRLAEMPVRIQNKRILDFLSRQKLVLDESQRIEIPLAMIEFIHSISSYLRKGIMATVDYGYTNEEWMVPARKDGSLRGYYRHQLINNVLHHPGEMDITSHIHFDALIQYGEDSGLSFIRKLRQDEFFLSVGILKELQDHFDPNPFSEVSKRNRAIRSLILPSGMSSSFHVILQQKGMDDMGIDWFEK